MSARLFVVDQTKMDQRIHVAPLFERINFLGGFGRLHKVPLNEFIAVFFQVVPKKISEVQKVLQSRLLSKQLSRQMPTSSSLTTSAINNSDSITTASKEYKEVMLLRKEVFSLL